MAALPLEIILDILKFLPVYCTLNFLLISKEYYQHTNNDIFWKQILQNYLLNEIKNCKNNLQKLVFNKILLQEFFNKITEKNTINKKYILKKINENELLSIKMNTKLLLKLTDFYDVNYLQRTSCNKTVCDKKITKKPFKHLLQQCIKCKWSVLINCFGSLDINYETQFIFKEIFLLEKDITINEVYKRFSTEGQLNMNNLQYILDLLKEIKNKLYLHNIIFNLFMPKLTLFINPYLYAILIENKDENKRNKILSKILQYVRIYNLKLSFNTTKFKNCASINFKTIPNEFMNYLFNIIKEELYKHNEDYKNISYFVYHLMEDNKVIDESFCNKSLSTLLICKEDKSQEIYNLLDSLQFFQCKDIVFSFTSNFFKLTFNINNFKCLVNLNSFPKDYLLSVFHCYLIKYIHYNENNDTVIKQIKSYLNYFINDLKFDVYGTDDLLNNIIINAFKHSNTFITITVIEAIKEFCNLQQINYHKLSYYRIQEIIQNQLTSCINISTDFFTLQSVKLKLIKELLCFKDFNHTYLVDMSTSIAYSNIKLETLLGLKYLISNVKMIDNTSKRLQQYVQEILEREDSLKLDNLIRSKHYNITEEFYKGKIDSNSNLFVYFIYKNFQNKINELEQCISQSD
ncbi:hypothetical protein ABK040_004912 [Willaertia magna]